MAETTLQYGPNKALSWDPPDKRDLELNELLLAELKAQKNFESVEEGKKRYVNSRESRGWHSNQITGKTCFASFTSSPSSLYRWLAKQRSSLLQY